MELVDEHGAIQSERVLKDIEIVLNRLSPARAPQLRNQFAELLKAIARVRDIQAAEPEPEGMPLMVFLVKVMMAVLGVEDAPVAEPASALAASAPPEFNGVPADWVWVMVPGVGPACMSLEQALRVRRALRVAPPPSASTHRPRSRWAWPRWAAPPAGGGPAVARAPELVVLWRAPTAKLRLQGQEGTASGTGGTSGRARSAHDRCAGLRQLGLDLLGERTLVEAFEDGRERSFEGVDLPATARPDRHRLIKKLYEADRLVMKLPPSQRTAARRNRAGPVLDAFKRWLDTEQLVVLPNTPIADAIGYTRNQWGAVTRFLDDARLKLDDNAAERSLRRVLTRVSSHPARDVLALSPEAWKQQLQDAQAR